MIGVYESIQTIKKHTIKNNIMKKLLILTFGLLFLGTAFSQNMIPNITANKYSYLLNETGFLEVTIENAAASSTNYVPQYKLRPLISIGRSISITKVDLPEGWTILENSYDASVGTTLRLSNATDGGAASGFGGGTIRTIIVHFVTTLPTTAEEGSNINMAYSTGVAPGTVTGPPTVGDRSDDNFSDTRIIISSTVPVSYTQALKGVKSGSGVELSWKTGVETNNKGFAVQKSTDNGANYTTVAFVDGKGSNSSYSYTDNSPVSGVNQYRLEQLDLDGRKSLSNVVSVTFDGVSGLSVYPNPATTQITVKANGLVQVYDLSGKLVLSQQSVNGTAVVNISRLAKGTYVVKSGTGNAKFIKL